MSEILINESELSSYLERVKGEQKVKIIVGKALITSCIPVIKKYNYALVDAEDLPNDYFKLTLEYRGS
ncbi:hypothetical protein GWK48_08095 [Metallosphaera tengchongensis]|uniref:Uncharacterized protein n=1 Tax=Metallosphaera tengchongensis TaxID=1532350 RepID=A0A6N0NZ36_9CREN|nr:hypothetical protein [Metallosphaera tengchongensis]QKR00340.1 hypothetical protein GWK48_08095 [Metallosphaera tengchongensis]